MQPSSIKSIRPFLGSKNYKLSRKFYRALGFAETTLGDKMSVFQMDGFSFYLQDYYAKDWVDNTMVFLEVDDLAGWWAAIKALDLPARFPGVRLKQIVNNDWGQEFFLHDPAGILWHIGTFKS